MIVPRTSREEILRKLQANYLNIDLLSNKATVFEKPVRYDSANMNHSLGYAVAIEQTY